MPGQAQANSEPVEQPHYPKHLYASPSSAGIDPSMVKPHACMVNVVQRGSYIHCHTGNHGMRIPPGKILVKGADGVFTLEDMVIRDRTGEPV
jgi:hypothetical protein